MTEAPPIGSIVIVTTVNKSGNSWIGLKFKVSEIKKDHVGTLAFGHLVEDYEHKQSRTICKVGREASFYLDSIELVESEDKKLGEAIIVFKEGLNGDMVGDVSNLVGVKFLRKYLNGRNEEYIYEVSNLDTMKAMMTTGCVKTFLWIPMES